MTLPFLICTIDVPRKEIGLRSCTGPKGHTLRCRKLPFSNGVISALAGRIHFHGGVGEEFARFLKEFGQALLVRELESEGMVVERKELVKLLDDFGNPSLIQSSQD